MLACCKSTGLMLLVFIFITMHVNKVYNQSLISSFTTLFCLSEGRQEYIWRSRKARGKNVRPASEYGLNSACCGMPFTSGAIFWFND